MPLYPIRSVRCVVCNRYLHDGYVPLRLFTGLGAKFQTEKKFVLLFAL